MEKSKFNFRYLFCGLLLTAVLLAYTLRLADWQIVKGATFLEKAQRTTTAQVPMDAARGEIMDVNGVGLAVNKTGYAIQFERAYMPDGSSNKTIAQLISLLNQRGEKWTDILPITLDKNGKPQFAAGQEKEIATLKSRDFLHMADYATAQECMTALIDKYEISGYSPKETRDIASVRYNMTKSGFGLSAPYLFAPDVSKDTVGIVSENSQLLPGATIKVTTVRQYPQGGLLPHILGNVGALDADEYKANKDKGYALNDEIGKSGVEQALESTLRGSAGEKVVETTSTGALSQETVTKAPVSGESVYLTIDSNLQKVVNASLAKNVRDTQAYGSTLSAQNYKGSRHHGEDCVAGAAVVLRVKDFAVLAASTYPSYDMNEYLSNSDYRVSLNKDSSTKPLINRAFNGIFTPGSSFKPSVALAALQEGAISNFTQIFCGGVFTRFSSQGLSIKCMGHHGNISLNTALAKSCNVFFCETAYRTGIDSMNLYAKRLGLGVKTGIELSESPGTLAGRAERTAAGGSWWDGDTSQAGIGQSDNQFTPLQLATYTATIANSGVRLQTHVVDKITDYARDKVITQKGAVTADSIGVSAQNLKYVQQGMRSVATSGTAASVFGNYGIAIAAKTGTAQTGNNSSDNVVFIGYAPYDNPQIAIAVVLEHGATSKFSNAVAKDIFDAYFYHTTVDANGNIVTTAEAQAQSAAASGANSSVSGAGSSASGTANR